MGKARTRSTNKALCTPRQLQAYERILTILRVRMVDEMVTSVAFALLRGHMAILGRNDGIDDSQIRADLALQDADLPRLISLAEACGPGWQAPEVHGAVLLAMTDSQLSRRKGERFSAPEGGSYRYVLENGAVLVQYLHEYRCRVAADEPIARDFDWTHRLSSGDGWRAIAGIR